MRWILLLSVAAVIAVVLMLGGGLRATHGGASVPITVDGGWIKFYWYGSGPVFNDEGPFTFTSSTPTTLSVTDDYCRGDQLRIFDFGVEVGDTSAVGLGACVEIGPDAAFADPTYSSGFFPLGPGDHSITIQAIANPFESGAAFMRVDSAPIILWPTYGATPNLPVTLDWHYFPDADRYQVDRYDKMNGKQRQTATVTQLSLKDAQANVKNWWRVRACQGSRCGPWSDWRYFVGRLATPALVWPKNATTPKLPVTLDWRYVPAANRYQVHRYDTIRGSRIVKTTASKLDLGNAQANVKNWWRVRACQWSRCGPWSEWRYFTGRLGVPTLVSPSNGKTFGSLPVTLDWGYVPSANRYQVRRYDSVNGYETDSTTRTWLSATDAQPDAKNWWRVRACQGGRCGLWSGWRYFSYVD